MIFTTQHHDRLLALSTMDRGTTWCACIDGGRHGAFWGSLRECDEWFTYTFRAANPLLNGKVFWLMKQAQKWLADPGGYGVPAFMWR